MIFDIGRICIKLAGRDAGKTCVIVDIIDDNTVLIEGQTRRRKCNIMHLEPTKKTIDIAKGADIQTVAEALKKEGVEVITEKKSKKTPARSKKSHVVKGKSKKSKK